VGTTARSINNQGQITGGYTDANGLQHGYIRQANGAFTKMDAPAQFAGKAAEGWGISNNGDVLGVFLGPPYSSDADSFSFIRDTNGNFTTFPWRASGSYGYPLTGAINNSRDYVLWGDPLIYHPDGSSTPLSYPTTAALYSATYGLNDAGEVAATAYYYGEANDQVPFIRTPSGQFPGIYCPGALPTSAILDEWTPSSLSADGKVAGHFDGPLVTRAYIATPEPGEPSLHLSKTSLTFPLTVIDHVSHQSLTLTNTGDAPLSLGVLFSNDIQKFGFDRGGCTHELAAGQSCELSTNFHPLDTSVRKDAKLVISDGSLDAPHVIDVSGTAVQPVLKLSATAWSFSPHPIGEVSGLGKVWVYNPGPLAIPFSRAFFSADDYSDFKIVTNTCTGSLPAFKTCSISFRFIPIAAGFRRSLLRIETEFGLDAGVDTYVNVSGTGLAKPLQFSNTNWSFSAHPVGQTSGPGRVWIYNGRTQPATFMAASLSGANPGDFRISSNSCSGTLATFRACSVTFNFTPTAAGSRTATLLLNSNASGSPQSIGLSGIGR
jgi:hypothetical protein